MTQRSNEDGHGDDGVPTFVREHTRYPVELAVRLRCDSWKEYLELYTSNLSRGGLFVASDVAAPMGSEVMLELALPDGEMVAMRAQVVHVVGEENGRRPGMGVMFYELDQPTRRALEKALQTARTQQPRPAAPPPPPEAATRAPKFGDAIEQALAQELARRTGLTPRQQLGVSANAGDAEVEEAYRQLHGRYAPHIFTRYGATTRAVIKSINELIDGARRQIAEGDATTPVLLAVPEAEPPTAAELEQRRRGDEARQSLRAGIERRVEEATSHRDMGRLDEAIRGFEAVLTLDRKHDYAREELRKLREIKAKKKR